MATRDKSYPTADERLGMAQEHIDRAWAMAKSITEETPGKRRGVLINQVRAQVRDAAGWARTITTYWRCSPTPDQMAKASAVCKDGQDALAYAHRFSRCG